MDLASLSDLIATDRSAASSALDGALRKHHGTNRPKVMFALHELAIEFWDGDSRQVAFHRTHAYVYALEAGMWDEAEALYEALATDGRV